MSIKVLFVAADPLAFVPGGVKLGLAEDLRKILEKVREDRYRNVLKFVICPAARVDDLILGLHESRPRVVHFSGHGGSGGLVFTSEDGMNPHRLDGPELKKIFAAFPGTIRLVVLSACNSIPQAQAIADVVGCAIGTNRTIYDHEAILFSATLYRAISFGDSVQSAFDKARENLVAHKLADDWPELVSGRGVDATRVVLVSPLRRRIHVGAVAALVLAVIVGMLWPKPPPPWRGVRLGDCTSGATAASVAAAPIPLAAFAAHGIPTGPEADLEQARAFCRAGNYAAAVPLLQRAAEAGDSAAKGPLGIAYLTGEGTRQQLTLAIYWLRESAREERDPLGMYALAMAYESGVGVQRSLYRARYWYRDAATKHVYAEAMRSLGRLYGAARPDSAFFWLRLAADSGSVDARVDLGMMLEQGLVGAPDPARALRLYRDAAQANSAWGMYALGRAYRTGAGVRQDYAQARAWYLKAACAESAEAMNELGLLYLNGWGTGPDRAAAIRWFRRADAAGSAEAESNLAALHPVRLHLPKLAWIKLPVRRSPLACTLPHGTGTSVVLR
jgi:TPR repeat protein